MQPPSSAQPASSAGTVETDATAHPAIALLNRDFLADAATLPAASIDLIVADPPYGLGKDYGNDSDQRSGEAFLAWTRAWLDLAIPKLKPSGSLYVFCTWQYAPEIFSFLKQKLTMVNEIIWDRRVPSMGGTTRRFTSVHDNIGYFAVSKQYYFDIDPVRVPYDAPTRKARARRQFEGSKWLELGYNPKDVWSVSRLHRLHAERVDHPTQKPLEIVERMVLASCPPGGRVLDPFMGSGTTAAACARHGRAFIGYEINPRYCAIARERVNAVLRAQGARGGCDGAGAQAGATGVASAAPACATLAMGATSTTFATTITPATTTAGVANTASVTSTASTTTATNATPATITASVTNTVFATGAATATSMTITPATTTASVVNTASATGAVSTTTVTNATPVTPTASATSTTPATAAANATTERIV